MLCGKSLMHARSLNSDREDVHVNALLSTFNLEHWWRKETGETDVRFLDSYKDGRIK